MSYEEYSGWIYYFNLRPIGWQADNRAAIIAMSFGGSKIRPEDLFSSLKHMKSEEAKRYQKANNFAQKFYTRFKNKVSGGASLDD